MKTSIKPPIKIGLLFSFLLLLAFIPKGDDPIDKLVASLQKWTDTIPQEKVYLHTDKPYYALGDTIWFKGYVTIGSRHQLSALSGAMYVELISEKDSLVQRLKLPVTSGMVVGDFVLKDDYHQGSYRIRAYTQWMRNAGEDYFYDHTFLVGDVAGGDIVAKADFSYRDNKGKKVLTAILNYTNDQGKALGDKAVRYEIWADYKPLWRQNGKTDALGSMRIVIPDDIKQRREAAYIRTILQGSDKYPIIRDFPIKATLSQSDVQFFPESGNLVNGITSRVAFKAIGIDGLSIAIKGNIVDNDNKEIAKLETLHGGMGSFLLIPVSGKTYTANVIFEDGSTKSIPLPKVIDQGYVLSVYQPNKDSVLVRIHASAPLLSSSVNLIAHTSGETVFAAPVKIEKPITSIWLKKKVFPTGIAQFTLFNASGEPLNERIAFIRSNDLMQLDIKTAKTSYSSKEHVQVDLEAKDSQGKPTIGNFSVSVIDESKVPFDENKESTIFSNILLTSDLKGYVEEPNYYFAKTGDDADKALDNLMLTQGYRRFAWKELNNTIVTKPQFPAEGLGTVITGRVTTLTDKPVPDANISLLALRASAVKSVTADADGRFHFEPFFLTDSIKLFFQARTKNGSDKVKLLLTRIPGIKVNSNPNLPDASLNVHSSLKQYLDNGKQEDDAYEKLGMLDKVHRLKEVKIWAKKHDPLENYSSQWGPVVPEGHADFTLYVEPRDEYPTPGIYLQGLLPNVIFTMTGGGMVPDRSVYLNGRKLSLDETIDILNYGGLDVESIARVDLLNKFNSLIYMYGKEPCMFIYTKKGYVRKTYNPSVVNITHKGFNKVREFYSPKYDKPGANLKLPDLRSTVYWDPYLKTDVAGKTSFNFFNADGPGTYKVIVEGINANGELGRQVYRYMVED
jgi:hypothetical protein